MTKIVSGYSLFILCFCSCLHPALAQEKLTPVEEEIIKKIHNLPEVKSEISYVETHSKGKRHLGIVVYNKPTKASNYYWVKVWEDNGMSYVSHFNFFVTPGSLKIKYLDTEQDTLLDLAVWRLQKKHK